MLNWHEASRALIGAWRLARLDRAAMSWFECTLPGALHSFWAAAICYPGFVALLVLRLDPAHIQAIGLPRILLVETIGYVVGWTAYPLCALPFCRWLTREDKALGFIVAYNWAQVLQTGLLLALALFSMVAPISITAAAYIEAFAYLALLIYEWFIASIALEAGGLAATALVLLDVVLGASLSQITQLLAGQATG